MTTSFITIGKKAGNIFLILKEDQEASPNVHFITPAKARIIADKLITLANELDDQFERFA